MNKKNYFINIENGRMFPYEKAPKDIWGDYWDSEYPEYYSNYNPETKKYYIINRNGEIVSDKEFDYISTFNK